MSLHYLLDGYNIINQLTLFQSGTLEQRRKHLLDWVNQSGLIARSNNRITIVFDGKPEFFGGAVTAQVSVVFSSGESADDLIKRTVEQSSQKRQWVVVSDDKDIKLYVRALGAHVMGVKEFDAGLRRRSAPAKVQDSGKNISHTQAKKINDEFEKIWRIK